MQLAPQIKMRIELIAGQIPTRSDPARRSLRTQESEKRGEQNVE